MRTALRLSALTTCSLLIVAIGGCGTSGSNPVVFPEVRFEVQPDVQGAPAQFMVEEIVAGGVSHSSVAGKTFSVTGPFLFYLENAAPPYSGTFRQIGANSIHVEVRTIGTGRRTTGSSSGTGTVIVELPEGVTAPTPSPIALRPEVRFDVCTPAVGSAGCSIATDIPGAFDNDFSGTVGDPFITHLIGRASTNPNDKRVTTPAIIFLEGARDNVNGVFRGVGQAVLQVQLLINGEWRQTRIGSGDQVVREDL